LGAVREDCTNSDIRNVYEVSNATACTFLDDVVFKRIL
jgi:hypothetical protein